ncbi:hypothetical protein ACMHY6_003825 [Escherichia coli]
MMMANTLLAWMLALSRRNEGDSFDYICSIIVAVLLGSGVVTFLNVLLPSSARSNLIKLFRNQQVFNGRPCCGSRCISKASPTSANAPDKDALFMWARCPNVLFLLLTNPVMHPFDMAALSDKRA